MSRHAVGMCRRIARRAAPDDVTFPMSNYPYSTPSMPGRQTLADMVMFYGSAELRSRIRADRSEDEDLLSGLVDQVIDLVGTWAPTTEWHMMSVVRHGPDRGVAGLAGGDGGGRRAGADVPGGHGDPVRDRPRLAAAVPAAADAVGAPRRHRLTSRSLQPVRDRARAATTAARLAADLPAGRELTASEVRTLRSWTSLAQWVGTERGLQAVERVEETWPGYGQVAASSILNAYYTDPDVVLAVWDWLARHGVTEGLGFEPGCGRGDWIAAAPDAVRFDAVDIDPISVRVAAALTGANVVESRIEEWHLGRSDQALANGGYDVVVGNVPFSSHKPGVGNPHRDNLHNLAIARSVAMLRPGGVAAVLTSRFSLDSNDTSWRRRLAAEVDLVAAVRLPSRTHREAGTAVVTDLLILRRPLPGEQRPDPDWLDVEQLALDRRHDDHRQPLLGRPPGPRPRTRRAGWRVPAGELQRRRRPAGPRSTRRRPRRRRAGLGAGRDRTGRRRPGPGRRAHRAGTPVAGGVDRHRPDVDDRVLP